MTPEEKRHVMGDINFLQNCIDEWSLNLAMEHDRQRIAEMIRIQNAEYHPAVSGKKYYGGSIHEI